MKIGDTEWSDALRHHGILPQKGKPEKEITEDEMLGMIDATVQERSGTGGVNLDKLSLNELDEFEDEEDEAIIQQYRQKRLHEIKAQLANKITPQNYVQEVNKAGQGVWVLLHLYKQGITMCV